MGRARGSNLAERRSRRAAVDDVSVVMPAAAAFLAVRLRSVAEVRQRLTDLGYRADLAEAVIHRLLEMRYLDDATFARAWLESRDRASPRGATALRRELTLKGVDPALVADLLEERRTGILDGAADSELIAAERLLERRRASLLREPDPRKRRAKTYSLLARNGFAPEVCRQAASAFAGASRDSGS
ncbi:hypothetical protein BH20CHL6_BH20CHL6_05150 [soil metagenome]